jgi:uncharacterized protein
VTLAVDVAECLNSATFYPEQQAASYVADRIEQGVEIFKVHVQVGDFDVRDPLLERSGDSSRTPERLV